MNQSKKNCQINQLVNLKKLTSFFLCWLLCLPALAQEEVEMAKALRESGKIYVVVGVVVLIFIGMVIYLIKLDRKVSQIEREQNASEKE